MKEPAAGRPASSPRPDAGGRERPPSRARRWIRSLALLVPGFADLRRERPLVPPLVLIALLSITGAYSVQPLVSGALPGDEGRLLAFWLWLGAALAPALMGAKALSLAAVSWSGLVLAGRSAPFRSLLSIFLYGEAVLAFHGVALVLALHLRGPAAIRGVGDLYVPMGLDAVVSPENPVLEALVRWATVFHLLWLIFLVAALTRVAGLGRGAAWSVAGGAWLLTLAVTAARALAFG